MRAERIFRFSTQSFSRKYFKHFAFQVESVIFSDYRLIADFADKCQKDIEGNACGNVRRHLHSDSNVIFYHHSQGLVLECLQKMIDVVEPKCKEEMLRISELQVKLINVKIKVEYIYPFNVLSFQLIFIGGQNINITVLL